MNELNILRPIYTRILKETLKKNFFRERIIMVLGARQTGKTTLLTTILEEYSNKYSSLSFSGDNPDHILLLNNKGLSFLKNVIGNSQLIFIDEAHKIPSIGNILKMLVDHFKAQKQFIITASSTFNLLDATSEPLTGRKFAFTLYPLAWDEIYPKSSVPEASKNIEELLLYGTYPAVVSANGSAIKIQILRELTESYLYKDILTFQQVKNSAALRKLLIGLALQIGSEVSYPELAQLTGLDRNTVERYVDILEKTFVLFRLSPFAKNKRRTLSKLRKIYFYDVGVRNSLIENFHPLDLRRDVGALWENFLIVERMKYKQYHDIHTWDYFWRTYDGAEIDFVEETHDSLMGSEFKWERDIEKVKAPKSWQEDYPNAKFRAYNRYTFLDFLHS